MHFTINTKCGVRFDLGPKVKVILYLFISKCHVGAYLAMVGIQNVFITDRKLFCEESKDDVKFDLTSRVKGQIKHSHS